MTLSDSRPNRHPKRAVEAATLVQDDEIAAAAEAAIGREEALILRQRAAEAVTIIRQ